MIFARRLSILALIGLLAITAAAQTTVTWTGLGTPVDDARSFKDGANWLGGISPASGDNVVFGPGPSQNISFATDVTVGNITFNGIVNGYFFNATDFEEPALLTLNGNITTTAGSNYWGDFSVPVELSAGDHSFTTDGAALYHFGEISGTGGIIKNGASTLYLGVSNSYSGGTVVNAGTIGVGSNNALGYGPVTLNDGVTVRLAYVSDDVRLGNSFVLGANVNFNTNRFFTDTLPANLTLGNGDDATIKAVAGVTNVTLHLSGVSPLYLDGEIQDGTVPTSYTFASSNPAAEFILSGDNTYTGGTVVTSGTAIRFEGASAVPETGVISVASDGYAGLNDSDSNAGDFIGHFNPATSTGTIGFDGGHSYGGNIDLSSFTANGGEISLGTFSSATLTGAITPPTGSGEYRFRSSGTLFLEGSLTGNREVLSYSFDGKAPGILVLNQSGANDYTGSTRAVSAGIIFDSSASLSTNTTSLSLEYGGYMGVTDASGLSLEDLINQDVSVINTGVLGLDSHANIHNSDGSSYIYGGPIDFGSLTSPVYLGTASGAVISGAITTTNGGDDDYYFTGYNGGYLKVDTQLTGSKQVHIGLPGIFQDENVNVASVELHNTANNFTGGILLNSGQLTATDPLSLGGGTLTVDAAANSDGRAYLQTQGTVANHITLQSGILDIYASGPLTLGGAITGAGGLSTSSGSPLTISGVNSYAGGNSFLGTPVTVTQNTGLGSGSLSLTEESTVTFTSASPAIGSLLQGDSDTALIITNGGTLTITQSVDGYFHGAILESGTPGLVVKAGPAALTIYGDHDTGTVYTGGTRITEGKLIAATAGALGSGAIVLDGGSFGVVPGVTVTNPISFGSGGGKLSGNLTFNTPLTVGANAILSPGNSPGTMTFNAGLTLAAGGTLDFDIQSANGVAGTGYDLVSISGSPLVITATSITPFTITLHSLTLGNTAGNVSDFNAGSSYSWLVFDSAAGLTGFAAGNVVFNASDFSNVLGGGTFSITQGLNGPNDAIYLNFTPVPEPSTYLLMGAGLATMLAAARRRRRN